MLNPVLANGDLSLVAGNDYNTALGNVIDLDASQWPNLIRNGEPATGDRFNGRARSRTRGRRHR